MAAVDNFSTFFPSMYSPATDGVAVTPSDTIDLPNVTRMIWVGGAGALTVILIGGETVTLSGVPAGTMLSLRATRVKTSTASLIVALW